MDLRSIMCFKGSTASWSKKHALARVLCAIAAASALLYVWHHFTSAHLLTSTKHPRGQCVIPVFGGQAIGYEMPYIRDTVLAQAHQDGCSLTWLPREDLVKQSADALRYGSILLAVWGMNSAEITFLRENPTIGLRLILFDLSDEQCDSVRREGYTLVALVFRNYWCGQQWSSISYLLPGSHLKDNLVSTGPYWYPLGYAKFNNLPQSYRLPLSIRQLHWAWIGSVTGKPDRQVFLDAVNKSARTSFEYLQISPNFGGGLDQEQYTLLLHRTQFVPLPAGNNEQFRLWEVFQAGAIPVLPKNYYLCPLLKDLGFKIVCIDSWDDFLPTVKQWVQLPQVQKAENMAEDNWCNLQRVYGAVQKQVRVGISQIAGL